MSAWTPEELRFGLNKTYAADLAGVSPFLYFNAGEVFLEDQTRFYVHFWHEKATAFIALRPQLWRMPRMGSLALSAS